MNLLENKSQNVLKKNFLIISQLYSHLGIFLSVRGALIFHLNEQFFAFYIENHNNTKYLASNLKNETISVFQNIV